MHLTGFLTLRAHHVPLCANGGVPRRHNLVGWPFVPGGSQYVGPVGSAHLLSLFTLPQLGKGCGKPS